MIEEIASRNSSEVVYIGDLSRHWIISKGTQIPKGIGWYKLKPATKPTVVVQFSTVMNSPGLAMRMFLSQRQYHPMVVQSNLFKLQNNLHLHPRSPHPFILALQ